MTDNKKYDHPSFNQEFCTQLEFRLSKTFANSNRQDIKGFWCDGVSCSPLPDKQLTQKYVNDNRKVVTKAWIGKDGQGVYEMTIHFGQHSLRRYANGTQLIDCIPSDKDMNWIDIDPIKKKIAIRLK